MQINSILLNLVNKNLLCRMCVRQHMRVGHPLNIYVYDYYYDLNMHYL